MRLLDIVLGLSDENRHTLSSIIIHGRHPGGWAGGNWKATLSFHKYRTLPDEMQEIPGVVGLGRWRDPDQDFALTVVADNPVGDVESQVRLLGESGLIGNLDAARFESMERGILEWIIKAHAGSQQERSEWLFGLIKREERR